MSKALNIYAPVKRDAGKDAGKKIAAKEPAFTIEFFVCFFSFTMLIYSNVTGTMGIAAFLVPWIYVIMKNFYALPSVIRKNWPLFILPAWAMCSVLWSREPAWTLRASLELILTFAVGILASTFIKPKTLIASILSTFFVIALICIVKRDDLSSDLGPMVGIFGSKNAFSGAISVLGLSAIAVFLDKNQPTIFRITAITGMVLTPLLLYLGKSMDAILSVAFAVLILLAVRFLSRFDHKIRLIIGIFIFMLGISLTLILSFAEFNPDFLLTAMGKDSTLTGRTYLWHRAADFISEKPFLGIGYNAFWRLSNIHARELWYASKVPMGAGFNFHNEYIDAWVGEGFFGLLIVAGYIAIAAKRVIKSILGSMTVEQYFALMTFAFLLIRTPVESLIFGQFSFNLIIFCVIWAYFRPAASPQKARIWPNIYAPKKLRSI